MSNIDRTAFYRSEDPIQNLRVKVVLRCVREGQFDTKAETPSTDAPTTSNPTEGGAKIYETVVAWQQKIPGPKDQLYAGEQIYTKFYNKTMAEKRAKEKGDEFPYQCAQMEILCPVDVRSAPEGQWIGVEHTLCTLKFFDDGRLVMKPDFSTKPYTFQTPAGGVYEYTLENVADLTDAAVVVADKQTQILIARRQQDLRANLVGSLFEPAPREHTDVYVYGEIAMARGFDCDSLYVEYTLQLPEGWKLKSEDERDEGVSQLAYSHSPVYEDTVGPVQREFNFCLPLEFKLSTTNLTSWPSIYLHACSYDYWDRNVTRGYGYCSIPNTCGSHTVNVGTWIPIGTTLNKLSTFFIGESPQLSDLSFVTIPPAGPSPKSINKYGLRTESSGEIMIRLNVITQSFEVKKKPIALTQSITNRSSEVLQSWKHKQAQDKVQSVVASLLKKTT